MLEVDTGGQRVPIVDMERALCIDEGEVADVAICAATADADVFAVGACLGVGEGEGSSVSLKRPVSSDSRQFENNLVWVS